MNLNKVQLLMLLLLAHFCTQTKRLLVSFKA